MQRGPIPTTTSYTAKALAVCTHGASAADKEFEPLSRADFIQALGILSTRLTCEQCRFELFGREIDSVQVAYLRYPYYVWHQVFGDPVSRHEHVESAPLFPVEVWRYECVDGPLACVGHLVDDLYGKRWVTFVRLCEF